MRLSAAITPTYVKECTAFIDNDDLNSPEILELKFNVRFRRRSDEERKAYETEIKETQLFIMSLIEQYGDIDLHRLAIKKENPEAFERLQKIENEQHDMIARLAYEDWTAQTGLQDDDDQNYELPRDKDFLWNFGHGEIRAAIKRKWIESRNGAQARSGNSVPLPARSPAAQRETRPSNGVG